MSRYSEAPITSAYSDGAEDHLGDPAVSSEMPCLLNQPLYLVQAGIRIHEDQA
jgi:hypothetical protein